jgi:hypothetical protein
MKSALKYYLKDLEQQYGTSWITDTRVAIATKLDYPLRTSDRHLKALVDLGHLEHSKQSYPRHRAKWRIITMP